MTFFEEVQNIYEIKDFLSQEASAIRTLEENNFKCDLKNDLKQYTARITIMSSE